MNNRSRATPVGAISQRHTTQRPLLKWFAHSPGMLILRASEERHLLESTERKYQQETIIDDLKDGNDQEYRVVYTWCWYSGKRNALRSIAII